METIILTGRNSKLSLIQIELVKARIEAAFPGIDVVIKSCSSRGDRLQNIPLQTVEGTDFFTEEVFENLYTGDADIAVHSLKDMSAEHLFGGNYFAVTDRDDVRDVAIFNSSVLKKIESGQQVVMGTCSPRRELMATDFLRKALPQLHDNFAIQTKVIRGNVDTRLRKLDAGEYDGIILATAGLNRLLRDAEITPSIHKLLSNKKIMVLPLVECVPAPCQGAIVTETIPTNKKALKVLEKISNPELLSDCIREKQIALQYGAGCDQQFGVATVTYGNQKSFFASGKNGNGKFFENWFNLPEVNTEKKKFWDDSLSSKDSKAVTIERSSEITQPVVFVSNHKAISHNLMSADKRVWAAGTKTWLKLANQGIWVEGCADGLGLESLQNVWSTPFVDIKKNQVTILTHEGAVQTWQNKNWNVISTYRIDTAHVTPGGIQSADILFWSSSLQFHKLKHLVKPNALHVCASGETSHQLKQSGINPIVFPTIQSFQQWKTRATHSPIEG